MGMNDCLFCKIIAGDIPSEKIYEDDHVFAFLDINPVNPGHTLVVPKMHSQNLYDTDDATLASIMAAVKKIAIAVKQAVSADGINIEMNNDPAAGQVIFHIHVHIIPRSKDDGAHHWEKMPYSEGEDKRVAETIRKAF